MQDSFEYKGFVSAININQDGKNNTLTFSYETHGKNAGGEEIKFKTTARLGEDYVEYHAKDDPSAVAEELLNEEIRKKIDEGRFEDTQINKIQR